MASNRVCDLFGIEYPILQGGMLWLASAELASAVSNAGALGVLSPYAGMDGNGDPLQTLRSQIHRTNNRTSKPFGVNIPIDLPVGGLLVDILLQERIRIAITAAGDPKIYTDLLHSAGIRVAHVVSSVKQARRAEACGVDAVIAEGMEAGGRIGPNALSLISLVPLIADAVSLPVIAAGGIVDGRGLAAAFALGADGVQLGTRFAATEECIAHPNYKQAIVDAKESDTVVTRRASIPTRSIRRGFTAELEVLEKSGASAESIQAFVGRGRARKAQLEGDLEAGDAYAGSSVGLIREILPAAEVIEKLIKAYREICG
ncbi:MAG TPA: nitronate monooxygenase [Acidobacteriota bacterium]|nr:nitronate monooxygenase [Acidobacteriota bacterium]